MVILIMTNSLGGRNIADLELSSHRLAQAATQPLPDNHVTQCEKRKVVNADSPRHGSPSESDSESQPKKRLKGQCCLLYSINLFNMFVARERLSFGTNCASAVRAIRE
jgi:hypothetical protein